MEPEFEGNTPRFTQKLKDVDAVPGKTARLECRVIGDPRPDIRWYRENEPLLEGGRYKFEDDDDRQVLVIDDVCGSDEGMYKCVARNSAGKAHCSADLYILRKRLICVVCFFVYCHLFVSASYNSLLKQHLIVRIASSVKLFPLPPISHLLSFNHRNR